MPTTSPGKNKAQDVKNRVMEFACERAKRANRQT